MNRVIIHCTKALILPLICVLSLLSLPAPASADAFASSYRECIRESAGNIASPRIAREIMRACRIEVSASTQDFQKRRARCQRQQLAKARNNQTVALVRRYCILAHPITTAAPSDALQFENINTLR